MTRRQTAQALHRYLPTKRHTRLLDFLAERGEEVTSRVVGMSDILIGRPQAVNLPGPA